QTPFGEPSAPILQGMLGALDLCFLPRHGKGHAHNPSEVPYRANVYALRALGVTHLISISAIGSLKEHLPPGTMVLPDQIIDRTVQRARTFFEGGVVAHVSMADPFCASFQGRIAEAAASVEVDFHRGGAYVCIEGPQFSTRAESQLYRSWNADVIGMTAMPEARLARESGLCYAIVATVTDYDVWHESEEDVSVEAVLQILRTNVEHGKQLVTDLTGKPLPECEDGCAAAPVNAFATHPETIPVNRRAVVDLLTSRGRENTA
ncbi:MAG TPA: S-methyl-5'-thioadenosine phosphorylase, partial [Thermomicrobiales bacterium]|nr:S-methyl-5'-thioadenosine phosphorylase [Thermomicrobiales bacterium]